MKKIKFLFIAAIATLLIYSCGKEKTNDIVGTWKISDISSSTEISAELKKGVEESWKEMKDSYVLKIKADSTFEHSVSGTSSVGKWKLSPDSKQLTLFYQDGEPEISNIVELTSDKMVTKVEFNGAENTFTFVKEEEKK
jgi:hypothetical protein